MRSMTFVLGLLLFVSAPLSVVQAADSPAVVPPTVAPPTVAPPTVVEDPLQRQVLDIAKELRCTVCQNQPVSESNSDLARDMRALIGEQLQAGRSREEIINYFVERYGDYVLMKPPYERTGTILWLLPPLLFLVLAISAGFFIRRHTQQPVPPAPKLTKADQTRVRAARNQDQNP